MKQKYFNLFLILLFFVLTVLIVSGFSQRALATNVAGLVIKSQSSKVLINFFANYDYYSRDIPFRFIHQVEALDFVRSKLVDEKRLQNIPIFIQISIMHVPSDPEHTELSLERNCALDYGDTVSEPTSFGPCYQISMDEDFSHSNFLTLTLALKKLTSQTPKIQIPDMQILKAEFSKELRSFQNIVQHFDPIWSPDGKQLLFTVWRDGQIHFEVLDLPTKQNHSLESLTDYMATRPLWSFDSRYVAYASLKEVKIFDMKRAVQKTISLNSLFNEDRNEILMTVGDATGKLTFSLDTNLLSSYFTYNYDLSSEKVTLVSQDISRPRLEKELDWKRYASRKQVKSPSLQWTAILRSFNGLRQVAIHQLTSDIIVDREPYISNNSWVNEEELGR